MLPEQILDGYDVVDNSYFWNESQKARHNPAAYRRLAGLETPGPFFLASARFIKRKNLDGLLRAYGTYRERRAGRNAWRLVILGDGAERQGLERIIDDEGLDGVSMPGFRQIDELPAYYGLAGAFIHPPLQEQWGLVVNEAMASGLPVLVSDRCGCAPDLVREGENGFTFDPEDSGALAMLMDHVSSRQVDLAEMGRSARSHISLWGPERFAEGMYRAFSVATSSR
jgi:glycosyltransferase involved in cell wall biosynthesis